jgi:hypothetical protein
MPDGQDRLGDGVRERAQPRPEAPDQDDCAHQPEVVAGASVAGVGSLAPVVVAGADPSVAAVVSLAGAEPLVGVVALVSPVEVDTGGAVTPGIVGIDGLRV